MTNLSELMSCFACGSTPHVGEEGGLGSKETSALDGDSVSNFTNNSLARIGTKDDSLWRNGFGVLCVQL